MIVVRVMVGACSSGDCERYGELDMHVNISYC